MAIWTAAANLLLWLEGRQPGSAIVAFLLAGPAIWLWLVYRRADRSTAAFRRMAASLAILALLTMTGLQRGLEPLGWLLVNLGALGFARFAWFGEQALRASPPG